MSYLWIIPTWFFLGSLVWIHYTIRRFPVYLYRPIRKSALIASLVFSILLWPFGILLAETSGKQLDWLARIYREDLEELQLPQRARERI